MAFVHRLRRTMVTFALLSTLIPFGVPLARQLAPAICGDSGYQFGNNFARFNRGLEVLTIYRNGYELLVIQFHDLFAPAFLVPAIVCLIVAGLYGGKRSESRTGVGQELDGSIR